MLSAGFFMSFWFVSTLDVGWLKLLCSFHSEVVNDPVQFLKG
jgi:hypothetical protein